jgi:hypothetical protein
MLKKVPYAWDAAPSKPSSAQTRNASTGTGALRAAATHSAPSGPVRSTNSRARSRSVGSCASTAWGSAPCG